MVDEKGPLGCFIGNAPADFEEGRIELVRPDDSGYCATLLEAGKQGVSAAVASSVEAFREHRRSPVSHRSALLRRLAGGVRGNRDDLAKTIALDVGKPIRAARFEVDRGSEFLEGCAATIENLPGEVLPVDAARNGASHFGFTRRVPYGVVGAITPFNAPINLFVQKIGPAIAAGNAVVAKPAPSGMRTALAVANIAAECGFPPGLLNVIGGDRDTALALAAHPDVSALTFTGGLVAATALAGAAGTKKFVSELGSNAANIVMEDADIDVAAAKIAAAAFEASGQQCISAQRVIVARPVYDRFMDAFVAAAAALKVGPPLHETTDVGPMVHATAAARVMNYAMDAIERGGRFALAPKRNGCFVSPGIVEGVSRESCLWREEVFGPLAVVASFTSVEEAIELANDSPFGLQGAVFTDRLSVAMRFSEEFEVGSLWINEASRFRLDMYPFGGMKASGIGREGLRYAIEELSQLKFTGIRIDRAAMAVVA